VKIVIAASPEVAIPAIKSLSESKHQLLRIISQPDRAAGRGKVLTPTPVAQWAIDHGVELVRPHGINEIEKAIAGADCVITIGYGVLLPEALLSKPRHGFLNLHFSLLPRWRGAAPVQRAIEAGDSITGVTVFKLDAGMDTGPIYTMHRYALDGDITSDELLIELGEVGVAALHEALEKIENGERPTPQSNDGATRASKLSRDEGRIDWALAANLIHAKIRAFTSNPGAWTAFKGVEIKLMSPIHTHFTLPPGRLSIVEKKLIIGTGTTALEIGLVIPQGKREMSGAAWANGARISSGDICE
jgi:methionyl-tRNA formyltransferase